MNTLVKVVHDKKGIVELILNRPDKRNALSISLMEELCHAFDEAEKDFSCRVVILRGAGSVFCAGLDLLEVLDPEKTKRSSAMVAKMLKSVYGSSKVTIAQVHGVAYAGGAGLMAACDFAIADEKTTFGFPEVQKGLVAAQVLAVLLPQLKVRDLRELLLFGSVIAAEKAVSIGLINRHCGSDQLAKETYQQAALALKGAPHAQAATKQLIDQLSPQAFEETLETALKSHYLMRQSDEAKEGIAAFLEKRNPMWMEN